jgi:hypothetical protein
MIEKAHNLEEGLLEYSMFNVGRSMFSQCDVGRSQLATNP